MSTVIPYGAKINVPADEFFNFVKTLEAPLREVWDEKAAQLASVQLIRAYTSDSPHSVCTSAEDRWAKLLKKTPDMSDMFLSFEVVFGQSNEGNILANPFGARPLIERFLDLDQVEHYSFDNRAAGPEDHDLTPKQYARREREWEDLFDQYDSFAALARWTLPRNTDIFTPMILRQEYRQAVLDKITPEDIARNRLVYLVCKDRKVPKSDHKNYLLIDRWASKLPLDALGTLPPPFTRENLFSQERTSYQAPPGLLDTCPALK